MDDGVVRVFDDSRLIAHHAELAFRGRRRLLRPGSFERGGQSFRRARSHDVTVA